MSDMKNLSQIDKNTGELIDGFIAVLQQKQHMGFRSWFAMNLDAFEILGSSSGLTGRDYYVLFGLLRRLDFENLIVLSQADLARELNMKRTHVNRSISKLVKIEALIAGPKMGHHRSYKLNPNLGWKGSAKNHKKALQKRMDDAGISVVDNLKK